MATAVTKPMIADWLAGAERRCPRFAEPAHWKIFLDDVRKFVEADWLEKCAKLNWTDESLFNVDRLHPFGNPAPARTGLLPALRGRIVIGLHPDYARLAFPGAEDADALHPRHLQNISRHHNQSILVSIWSLMPELAATI